MATETDENPKNSKAKEQKILSVALERFKQGIEADDREAALDDLRFVMGEQWPEKIKKDRESDGRPCVTVNRVQQMVKQVVNDMRQNRAAIKVRPASGPASEDTAKVYSGLIRHIEVSSDAPDQYVSAAENCVQHGRGYFRILTEYEDESFNQCLKIARIRNPFSVVMDPNAKAPDGSDATWGFIVDEVPRDQFDEEYPGISGEFDETPVGASDGWITKDHVRVAEYYEIVNKKDTLYLMVDGSQARRSELPAAPPPELVKKSRQINDKWLVWRKIISTKILEEQEYNVPYVPIIGIYGEEYDIEGRVYRMGITRHAKDPQRIYNYSRTAVIEQIALAPKAPYVIAEGQLEGYEQLWKTANVKNHAYLPYKPTTVAGQLAPAPQRQAFAGVPAGSMADLTLASEEIKATTGIYDAALGAKSNETSGKAILARQREADNATYHYVDSFNRAVKNCARQLVEWIPLIYDTERTVQIIGEDDKESVVKVNQYNAITGEKKNDLSAGKYNIVLSTGPSYETKRIEAANGMTEFMSAVPNAAPFLADIIAKNMDWPGSEQISKRLQFMLPPEVREAESAEAEIPPPVIAKLKEMGQIIQELQGAVQEQMALNEELTKQVKSDDRKLDIETYKAATDRLEAIVKAMPPEVDQEAVQQAVATTLEQILLPLYTPVVETDPTAQAGLNQGVM